MTASDPQQILDRIRKNLRDADRDAFMGNLTHQARTEIPRLAEALEAVLAEHHKGYINVRYNRSRIAQCEECQVNWPCPTVRAIEAKLSEEET